MNDNSSELNIIINQCDGCQAGIPIVNGAHRMGEEDGYSNKQACTAKLYLPTKPVSTPQTAPKYYHVTEAGLVEGEALGRVSVVLKADYERQLKPQAEMVLVPTIATKAISDAIAGLFSYGFIDDRMVQGILTAITDAAEAENTKNS